MSLRDLPALLRRTIVKSVRGALGSIPERFDQPPGDPGWFGPGSVTWLVHSDFSSMIIGGVSALFLQSLHPGAMAGVADFSDYRRDPLLRLRRTASFVAGTTYGPTAMAEQLVQALRARHDRIAGVRPDGVPYAASDPALLRWVHVAEVSQFLRSFQRYGLRSLAAAERDRYFAEVARVAEALGATEVPSSEEAIEAYFQRVRPELRASAQTADVVDFLRNPPGGRLPERAAYQIVRRAAEGLLPRWARDLLGIGHPAVIEAAAVRPAAAVLATTLRWALGESQLLAMARRRAAATAA
jgi:uncharacterized protein (DUF2236 family)